MPTPAHVRLIFSGIFGLPAEPIEEWSWSLKFAQLGVANPANNDEAQANADAAAAVYNANILNLHSSFVQRTNVRVSYVDSLGKTQFVQSGEYHQADHTVIQPGGGALVARKPLQSAVCVTLDTPRPGPTGAGRFFLPQTVHDLGDDFRMSVSSATSIATGVKGLLEGLRPILGDARVFSSKGYSTVVDSIRVGRVPDTMRSRRRSTDEGYVATVLS